MITEAERVITAESLIEEIKKHITEEYIPCTGGYTKRTIGFEKLCEVIKEYFGSRTKPYVKINKVNTEEAKKIINEAMLKGNVLLTEEAYSDLCLRAAGLERSHEMPEEIVIRCVGNMTFSYRGDDIERWNFDYTPEVLRIDFFDGSFVEFYKQNIISVAWHKTVR